MNIHIGTAFSGEIKLSTVLPPSIRLRQIPGSTGYGSAGPFGLVLLQQLTGEESPILHYTLNFTDDREILISSEEPSIRIQIALQNSYYYDSKHQGKGALHERGIQLNFTPKTEVRVRLHKQQTYNHLSVYYTKDQLLPLRDSFPGLAIFLDKVEKGEAARFNEHYCIADTKILALVDAMLECEYKDRVRTLYLDSLAMELLLLTLVKMSEDRPGTAGQISATEAEQIYRAKETLLMDMGKTFTLPTLAEKTNLSIYKLNNGFKAIYGMGVMEFLLEARMKKAHQLLSVSEMTIGEISEESGYSHPHAFSLAFKKYFNYTPAFVQRSNKLHGHSNA